jgi:hypothetical protein
MSEKEKDTAKLLASAEVAGALKSDREIPKNIFAGPWDQFLFFDPDRVFDAAFVESVQALLEIEKATVACLCNLGSVPEDASFFIDTTPNDEAYSSFLHRSRSDINRYVCASDVGRWVIYGERYREIAIMAYAAKDDEERFDKVSKQLGALPIMRAIETPPCDALLPRTSQARPRHRRGRRRHRWSSPRVRESSKRPFVFPAYRPLRGVLFF